jgi:hypothetical protein
MSSYNVGEIDLRKWEERDRVTRKEREREREGERALNYFLLGSKYNLCFSFEEIIFFITKR